VKLPDLATVTMDKLEASHIQQADLCLTRSWSLSDAWAWQGAYFDLIRQLPNDPAAADARSLLPRPRSVLQAQAQLIESVCEQKASPASLLPSVGVKLPEVRHVR